MIDHARIVEMAPRDGLQNEKRLASVAEKTRLVNLLSDCGFEKIEVGSFVNPNWVPQMATSADVFDQINRNAHIRYTALTPNLKGYRAARAAKSDEIAVFVSASEGFSRKNLNASIDESLERVKAVAAAAKSDGTPMRGYVSCVADCPYDGPTPPAAVANVVEDLLECGCFEISLGDTIGSGTPRTIAAMLDTVIKSVEPHKLAGHFHDTAGQALQNIAVSLEKGLRVFDASVGGLGGCPFAPGAKGNVDTQLVHSFLADHGVNTGLDPNTLAIAARYAQSLRSAPNAL
jgi:hydroxymethylglutaryl-CoA lyase